MGPDPFHPSLQQNLQEQKAWPFAFRSSTGRSYEEKERGFLKNELDFLHVGVFLLFSCFLFGFCLKVYFMMFCKLL